MMGVPPKVLIVARHGARLDVEDKHWQEQSSTPYDTPLTYGGWTQARALGARIASILHARDLAAVKPEKGPSRRSSTSDVKAASDLDSGSRPQGLKQPKRKVIIHTSPFLRCVQTSIAISAGMSQYQGNLRKFGDTQVSPPPEAPSLFRGPTRSKTLDPKSIEALLAEKLGKEYQNLPLPTTAPTTVIPTIDLGFCKALLRIDAFLGEWLCPDYYVDIKAPPSSAIMVAAAKEELSKPAERLSGTKDDHTPIASPPNEIKDFAENTPNQTFSVSELADALPDTSSVAQTGSDAGKRPPDSDCTAPPEGYVPPTPNYAILATGSIPSGYVAHARDACIDVDRKWDSMQEPLNWGDGGKYDEEWSSMHNRLRKGLGDMVSHYRQSSTRVASLPETATEEEKTTAIDEDAELVLILVTHGAGCNALIGALTNQPVLLDVRMGSLTLAIHTGKKETEPSSERTPNRRRRSSVIDLGLSQEYEMKLIASTDHLRAGVDLLKIPQLQTSTGRRTLSDIPEHRRRLGSMVSSGSITPPTPPSEPVRPRNSGLGSIRRSTVGSAGNRRPSASSLSGSQSPASRGSSGLWGSPALAPTSMPRADIKDLDPVIPAIDDAGSDGATKAASTTTWQPPERSQSQGLWGASSASRQPPGGRRWTVQDRK